MPTSPTTPAASADPILQGGGECGALMRGLDWASNPLGPPQHWPQELRVVVGIALGSLQPMLIVWGPEQITLYNDAYAPMCGTRHPAIGRPFRELWFDIWERIDPIITAAYDGISTSMADIELVMHRNGYPEETHFAFSYSPVRGNTGAVLGMFCACAEITGQVMMQRRLAREREQMRQIFEMALGAVAIVSGPDHVFTFANAEYRLLTGRQDIVGKPVAEALPEAVEQGFVTLLDTVRDTREAYVGRGVEIDLQRTAGGARERRVLDFNYHPVGGFDGPAEGIFVQVIDITEQANAARQQALLNHELAHRMKNRLALVQAVANQTLRLASDLDSARLSLNQRIGVLARAQDMLLSGTAQATTVTEIVNGVTALHDDPADPRFHLEGPDLTVGPRAALSLSLMLHELSTNAAKYGALSVPGGSVSVIWHSAPTDDGDCFCLEWNETDGPPVMEPAHSGSGTRLLKAGISGARISKVDLHYHPEGVCCEICVDLKGLAT